MAGTPNPDGELEAMANEWRHDEYECASRMRAALDAYRAEHPPIGKWIRGAPVPGARPAAAAVDPSPPEPECACWLIRDQTWQEPAEWEQNPDCPVHPMAAVVQPVEPETWRHADGSVRVDHMDSRPGDYYGTAEQAEPTVEPDPPTDDNIGKKNAAIMKAIRYGYDAAQSERTHVGWYVPLTGTLLAPGEADQEDADKYGWPAVWVDLGDSVESNSGLGPSPMSQEGEQ